MRRRISCDPESGFLQDDTKSATLFDSDQSYTNDESVNYRYALHNEQVWKNYQMVRELLHHAQNAVWTELQTEPFDAVEQDLITQARMLLDNAGDKLPSNEFMAIIDKIESAALANAEEALRPAVVVHLDGGFSAVVPQERAGSDTRIVLITFTYPNNSKLGARLWIMTGKFLDPIPKELLFKEDEIARLLSLNVDFA